MMLIWLKLAKKDWRIVFDWLYFFNEFTDPFSLHYSFILIMHLGVWDGGRKSLWNIGIKPRYKPEDTDLNIHPLENLKSLNSWNSSNRNVKWKLT